MVIHFTNCYRELILFQDIFLQVSSVSWKVDIVVASHKCSNILQPAVQFTFHIKGTAFTFKFQFSTKNRTRLSVHKFTEGPCKNNWFFWKGMLFQLKNSRRTEISGAERGRGLTYNIYYPCFACFFFFSSGKRYK